ncbi:hypothetical protein [Parabacteroides sp. FAFU027]|uniref:hypothetical protein n=1 Tax=Parabacteroides sp. FAFU027 TaxID=2922715 RepID=UPI001FAFFC2D|nr:hypothetical protein [Parabacteroides sp. FAFU027]
MATKQTKSETEILEQYRVSLENADAQPEIKAELEEFGYDQVKIGEGKQIYSATRKAYDDNKREDDESTQASSIFKAEKEKLDTNYSLLRKKAKVVFSKDTDASSKLSIDSAMPKAYISWIETIRKFYTTLNEDAALLQKISRLKVTAEDVAAGLAQIAVVEKARAEFLRESGESQAATDTKDAAFAQLDEWMGEFYAVARIALEDKPQLLEVLGKIVR